MTDLRTLTVDGGRVIEYAIHGTPSARRAIIHHGLVGSADLAPEWTDLAAEHGVEVLTVARPGYGRSTPTAMTAVADWATLLAPLLDELGWDRYDTVGISAGAAYAYALAALHPEQVGRVVICSGVTYVVDPAVLACYSDEARTAYQRYATAPTADIAAEMTSFLASARDKLPDAHRWRAAIDASLANGAAGMAREAQLQIRPWGFHPRDIRQPVHLWHARDDQEVPFPAMVRTGALFPNATIRLQPESGHTPSNATARRVFEFLSADTEPAE